MPEPLGSSQRYMPGLDGLRAVAVLAVIAYHLEFAWAQGGLLGVRVVRERSSVPGLRPRSAAITLVLAAGSAAEMALLYRPSFDPSRVYFGTDTRAFELLAGAALAMVWPGRGTWQIRAPLVLRAL